MRNLEEFFSREVKKAMEEIRFENRLIQNFLIDLLASNVHPAAGENVYCVRQEPALAFLTHERNADLEYMEKTVRRLLFVIGFFPESLVARGKRRVGLGYYLTAERGLIRRLSPYGAVWSEVNDHFHPTVRSLNLVRSTTGIKKPDIVTLSEIIKATGDIYSFY
ncbi:MAG TPA: hypothetical protein VF790_12380 [Dissulfurispiraceae bacterium]